MEFPGSFSAKGENMTLEDIKALAIAFRKAHGLDDHEAFAAAVCKHWQDAQPVAADDAPPAGGGPGGEPPPPPPHDK